MKINRERLAQKFTQLCEIDSPSHHEGAVASYLIEELETLGVDFIKIDDSAAQTGSDTGNVIARFAGTNSQENPIFFACHMDTVEPASNIKVVRKGDIFTSQGDTILGSDDKSGIVILLELLSTLKENSTPHCPIELIFTTCEEIGLLGAKAMDTTLLQSTSGYALDSSSSDKITIGAPAANSLNISIYGLAAHSGSAPEAGINALAIAAEAISRVTLGRLDDLSTANLGLIKGGVATNIVPDVIKIQGEVRSHSQELLDQHTLKISNIFKEVAENWPQCGESDKRPSIVIEVEEEFPAMKLEEDEPVLIRLKKAAGKIGRQLQFGSAGGGSDANIFTGNGIKTAILPTGMKKVHTTDEWIDLNDMVAMAELLIALVQEDMAV